MAKIKNIVVLVSGNGSNLQSIINACKDGIVNGNVVAVISNQESAFALKRASAEAIPTITVSHTSFESRESFESKLIAKINQYEPDLIVLAGFMRILTTDFVNRYLGKLINIHPSLLPKYPGLNTHQRAIDAGDKEHGSSVHFVTPELDGGPVILQSFVPIFPDDNKDELASRSIVQEHIIFPKAVKWFCDERLQMKNGKAYLDGKEVELQKYEVN